MTQRLARYGAALAFTLALALPFSASASVAGLASSAPAAPGASTVLSSQQINSIMSLLRAFGADQSVIANVQASLTGAPAPTNSSSCVNLSYSLYTGQTDSSTNGDVTRLQNFLSVTPTGYFGPMTEQAVQKWQAAHGIVSSGSPDTTGYGLVGPQTSEAMGCVGSPVAPMNSSDSFSGVTFTATPVTSSTYQFRFDPGPRAEYGYVVDYGDGASMTLCSVAGGCTRGGTSVTHGYTRSGTFTADLNALKSTDGGTVSRVVRQIVVQVSANATSSVSNSVQITLPTAGSSFAQDTYIPVTVTGSVSRQAYGNIQVLHKVNGEWQALPWSWPIQSAGTSVGPGQFSEHLSNVIFSSNAALTSPTPPGAWAIQAQMYTYGCGGDDCNPPTNRVLATSDIVPITITAADSDRKSATIDQSSLSQNTTVKAFAVTGGATNTSSVTVIASSYNYNSSDYTMLSGQIGKDGIYLNTAPVLNGKWATSFDWFNPGTTTFYVYVYDSNTHQLLTSNSITVTLSTANGTMPTSAQISSEVRLLQSFGASAATIANVQAALGVPGSQFNSSVPASVTQSQHDAVISLLHSWGIFPAVITAVDNALPVRANGSATPGLSIPGLGGQTYTAGDNVLFHVRYSNANVGSWICASFTANDQTYYAFPSGQSQCNRTTSASGDMVIQGIIPTNMPSGTYHLHAELYYSSTGQWGTNGGQYPLAKVNSGNVNMLASPSPQPGPVYQYPQPPVPTLSVTAPSIAVKEATRPYLRFSYANVPSSDVQGVYLVSSVTGTNVTSMSIGENDISGTGDGSLYVADAIPAGQYFLRILAVTNNRTLAQSLPFTLGRGNNFEIQSMSGFNVVVRYSDIMTPNATLRIAGPGNSNAVVSSEGITAGSGIIGAALPSSAPAGDYRIYIADATGSGVTNGLSFYYGGFSGVDVLNSLVSTGAPFTLRGSSTRPGQIYLLAMSPAYSFGVDYATASSHLKDGSGVYQPINNSVVMNGSSWSANFNALPDANYRLGIYDSSYRLIGTALLMVNAKG